MRVERRLYIEELQAFLASGEVTSPPTEDNAAQSSLYPHFGPWAAFYEPVFAFASMALKGMLHVVPERRERPINDDNFDKNSWGFDIATCADDLFDTLEYAKSTLDDIPIAALAKLLQNLFDDPSLEVKAKQDGEGEDLSDVLEICGECYTAHGLPAPYIMGIGNLTPGVWDTREVEGLVAYKHAIVGSKVSPSCWLASIVSVILYPHMAPVRCRSGDDMLSMFDYCDGGLECTILCRVLHRQGLLRPTL